MNKMRIAKGAKTLTLKIKRSIGFLADMHVGSSVAIWPKEFKRPNESSLCASRGQRTLLEYWDDAKMQFKDYGVDTVIIPGDITEGKNTKGGGRGLIANQLYEQQDAAVELLTDIIPSDADAYIYSGTQYHESDDMLIAETIADKLVKNKVIAKFAGTLTNNLFGGTRVRANIYHGTGGSPLYRATKMDKEQMFIQLAEHNWDKLEEPTDIIIRAHNHFYGYLSLKKHSLQLPCWKAFELTYTTTLGNYGRFQPDIGAVIMLIDEDDNIWIKRFDYKLPHIVDKFETI
ncbi:MAG: hypothetical protein GY853_13235 [PVC group bacterium]|nr:hypothetical protein [PVC group bacterium]